MIAGATSVNNFSRKIWRCFRIRSSEYLSLANPPGRETCEENLLW